jgi:sugar-specific transcriptional regulator TrmB
MKTQTTTIEGVLKSLGLPPFSQKIYRSLLENGETTARFLSESLGITRPSTYDHLEILLKKGLIVKKKIGQMTYFMPDDLRYIGQALERTIEDLEEKKKDFESILPTLLSAQVTEHPKISFYEGKDGLARIISDVLWYKGETVYTLWPYEEMLGVLGEEVLVHFNKRRIKEKIQVRSLWPHQDKTKKSHIWEHEDALTKRRYVPKGISYSMGYSVYGDKVSFIASHNEGFGFIVQSKDMSKLMRMLFEVLWNSSKE